MWLHWIEVAACRIVQLEHANSCLRHAGSSSLTGDGTWVPCTGSRVLATGSSGKSHSLLLKSSLGNIYIWSVRKTTTHKDRKKTPLWRSASQDCEEMGLVKLKEEESFVGTAQGQQQAPRHKSREHVRQTKKGPLSSSHPAPKCAAPWPPLWVTLTLPNEHQRLETSTSAPSSQHLLYSS